MKRMKCYLYTRVSTSMQVDGYSLDAQKDKLRKYAEFQNMLVAGEYCDEGKSGKNIEGRPEFLRMLRDIESGKDGVSFVLVLERVEISPERQSDGHIVKRIEFRFSVYFKGSEITGLGWEKTDTSEGIPSIS